MVVAGTAFLDGRSGGVVSGCFLLRNLDGLRIFLGDGV